MSLKSILCRIGMGVGVVLALYGVLFGNGGPLSGRSFWAQIMPPDGGDMSGERGEAFPYHRALPLAPFSNTGLATVALMAAGAGAGFAFIRRK